MRFKDRHTNSTAYKKYLKMMRQRTVIELTDDIPEEVWDGETSSNSNHYVMEVRMISNGIFAEAFAKLVSKDDRTKEDLWIFRNPDNNIVEFYIKKKNGDFIKRNGSLMLEDALGDGKSDVVVQEKESKED